MLVLKKYFNMEFKSVLVILIRKNSSMHKDAFHHRGDLHTKKKAGLS